MTANDSTCATVAHVLDPTLSDLLAALDACHRRSSSVVAEEARSEAVADLEKRLASVTLPTDPAEILITLAGRLKDPMRLSAGHPNPDRGEPRVAWPRCFASRQARMTAAWYKALERWLRRTACSAHDRCRPGARRRRWTILEVVPLPRSAVGRRDRIARQPASAMSSRHGCERDHRGPSSPGDGRDVH